MKKLKFGKGSWDPRSIMLLSQLPLHVNCLKSEPPLNKTLKDYKCYSCPDLLDIGDGQGMYKICSPSAFVFDLFISETARLHDDII